MIRHKTVKHEFVEAVPAEREEGTVYISIPFATAIHNCLCGCGMKVVTPIKPHKWILTFDGETISLHPSVGNWSFACQSHYVIRNSRVIDAGSFSKSDVTKVRENDEALRRRHYGEAVAVQKPVPRAEPATIETKVLTRKRSIWDRLLGNR
ncbi:hypothetical protein D3C73_34450 [compost metagenome]